MKERSWKLFAIVVITVSVITIFFDYRITLGYLLGALESVIHYKRLEFFWNGALKAASYSKGFQAANFLITWFIMAGVLLLCVLLPNVFNIFACAVGMLMIKITTYVDLFLSNFKEEK